MKTIFDYFEKHLNLELFVEYLNCNCNIQLANIKSSARSFFIAQAFAKTNKNFVVILNDYDQAAYFYNDLQWLESFLNIVFLPTSVKETTTKLLKKDLTNLTSRIDAIYQIANCSKSLIITYPQAFAETIVDNNKLQTSKIEINVGQIISVNKLIDNLKKMGYIKCDYVFEPGQFAQRGSIVDVFSYASQYPVRIDFLGDEIDSLRFFSVDTQLSVEKINKTSIIENIVEDTQNKRICLVDFLPQNTVYFSENFQYILQIVQIINDIKTEIQQKENQDDRMFFADAQELEDVLNHRQKIFLNSRQIPSDVKSLEFNIQSHSKIQKNFDLLASDIKQKQHQGFKTYICSKSTVQLQRLSDILRSSQVKIKVKFEPIEGALYEGFTDNDLQIAVYTDHQIFDRYFAYHLKNYNISKSKEAQLLREIRDLKVGDYVVHIDYGIGIFKGMQQIENDGKKQEVVRIDYADGGVVFVNIHGLHKISKYKNNNTEPPKLNKLGSSVWATNKEKAKKRIKDIAKELISLYAQRLDSKGFAFSPDNELQEALEATFMYEETPDQLKVINEVKKDMQKPLPMDRLVCGDVGFGKTEIALRAAFKAALDGKQVAVLCPTTILALQHFRNFASRLQNTPITISFISRLKNTTQQTETISKLSKGQIDIIIGTHRLVSPDVKFKDLGLLIIDEEQKFGVSVKEKLRQMRVNIDTLTLTATPIPRTMQFSLMGARDLSILQTPPPNRLPIVTELHTFNNDLIRQAILFEVKRGGQVFFVHNDIQSLPQIKQLINEILPQVSVEIAHGQMKPTDTENVITRFIEGQFDVLLTTSIIENGIDIPNANTIIINNANKFGLSDLHQLRGRVGRSSRKAYCYLIAPPRVFLTDNARRRLDTLEKFVELGSGFNIALQDLDIRGAGDLLGAEQSGFINDIGYETFRKILQEAMLEIQTNHFKQILQKKQDSNQKIQFLNDCQISTDLQLAFPDDFISDNIERLRIYRQLDNLENISQIDDFQQQLIDRFGKIPPKASELIDVIRLRLVAITLGIEKIVLKNKIFTCYFISDKNSAFYESDIFTKNIIQYVSNHKNCQFEEKNNKLYLRFVNIPTIAEALKILNNI